MRPSRFELMPGVAHDAYGASPPHRRHQNLQPSDCSACNVTAGKHSGGLQDLHSRVEVTDGARGNGQHEPAGFTGASTDEGASSLGCSNRQQGHAPYVKRGADHHSTIDNGDQPGMGRSTGLYYSLGCFGDALRHGDSRSNPATPLSDRIDHRATTPATRSWRAQDRCSDGSYSALPGAGDPRVAPIVSCLKPLPTAVEPSCGPRYLPHPVTMAAKLYVPTNSPAIGDFLDIAQFGYGSGGDSGQN